MKKYFTLILLIAAWRINCQPLVTDGRNNKILEWDSSYHIETTELSPGNTVYQYIVKRQSEVVARYFRHDDSSFLFTMVDSLTGKYEEGLLKLSSSSIDQYTISLPDFSKDLDGSKGYFKDSLISIIGYRKIGRWRETDISGKVFTGRYVNGLRDSIWEEGKLLDNLNKPTQEFAYYDFVPSTKHIYKNGIEISSYKDTVFWPKLKGKWYATIDCIDLQTYVFRREDVQRQYLNFESANLFSFIRPSRTAHATDVFEKYTATWKQNGDLIEFIDGKETKVLQVLSLTDYQLIIRFLKW